MDLVKDFQPFYASPNDRGPKVIEFDSFPHPEVANWKPVLNTANVQNRLSEDKTHVVQDMPNSGWPQEIIDLGPLMRFEPAPEGYALIDVNNKIKDVDIDGSGWHIVKWEIVATDMSGADINKAEVDRLVAAEQAFFICDKITWKLEDTEVITKHGYRHYR